jgi:hypothetical protein
MKPARHSEKMTTVVCNAASNPYYGAVRAGISDDQFRKILDNNILSNHWLIHDRARNAGTWRRINDIISSLEESRDHRSLVPMHFKGSRHADGAQSCRRIRAERVCASTALRRA